MADLGLSTSVRRSAMYGLIAAGTMDPNLNLFGAGTADAFGAAGEAGEEAATAEAVEVEEAVEKATGGDEHPTLKVGGERGADWLSAAAVRTHDGVDNPSPTPTLSPDLDPNPELNPNPNPRCAPTMASMPSCC